MLQAVFSGRGEFILIAAVVVIVVGLLGFLGAKRYLQRPWPYAGLAAVLAAELSVTLFFPSPWHVSGQCVLNRNYGEPFATEQGLLNLAMFVPIGFFGVLAVRRVLPVFLGGSLLSVVTELCQALAPWAGRSCDSSDVQMNVLGAGLGTLAAWASVRATRGELLPAQAVLKPMAVIFGNGLLACAVVWKLWITPLALDSTSLQIADGDEKAQARQVLSAAFDDHFDIANVQLQSGQNGAFRHADGHAEVRVRRAQLAGQGTAHGQSGKFKQARSRQLPRDRVSVSPQERRRRTSDSKEVRGRTVPVGAGRLSREGFWVVSVHGDITVVVVGLRDCCTDLLVRVLDSPDLVVW